MGKDKDALLKALRKTTDDEEFISLLLALITKWSSLEDKKKTKLKDTIIDLTQGLFWRNN
jgi:hypothetical protein